MGLMQLKSSGLRTSCASVVFREAEACRGGPCPMGRLSPNVASPRRLSVFRIGVIRVVAYERAQCTLIRGEPRRKLSGLQNKHLDIVGYDFRDQPVSTSTSHATASPSM